MKNKKMLRVVGLIAAIALLAVSVAGCGKAEDKDEQGRTVISVGSWPQKEGVDLDNINARKDKFEKDNTDVVITPDPWTFDLKTFYAKAAGGRLPTLYEMHYTEIEQCISSGYSADLTDVLKKRGYADSINKKILDVISDKDGRIYAFPKTAYVLGLGYNVELFEKAGLMEADGTPKQPKDWNELVEFGQKIKQATGKAAFSMPTTNNAGGWIFTVIAWSFGTEFMKQNEDGKWIAVFNSPEAEETLKFIKDMKWKYGIMPENALIDNAKNYELFATDSAAMALVAGSFTPNLTKYEMNPNKVGIMAIPAGPKKHVTLLGGNLYAVSDKATDDQIDASVRWLETTQNNKLTDDFKANKIKSYDEKLAKNEAVGIVSMSIWDDDTESVKFERDLIKEKANINLNHVKLYNDFVKELPCEIRPEEPVCTQELYGILDGCIQAVLTDKNADCKALLEKANSDFQANYLDNFGS